MLKTKFIGFFTPSIFVNSITEEEITLSGIIKPFNSVNVIAEIKKIEKQTFVFWLSLYNIFSYKKLTILIKNGINKRIEAAQIKINLFFILP